jgi:transcriptional regulator
MYRPPAFREDRPEILREMIRDHPLATLVTNGVNGLTANLIPFTLVVDADDKTTLRAHLAKANPQLYDLRKGGEALVIFQGPQTYITPSWYATKREHGMVVPTWNYIVVQTWGKPRVIDDAQWLLTQVEELTEQQENVREDAWAVSDAPPSFIVGKLKGITGLEIPVDRIEGKWKVSQNQAAVNRSGVVDGLRGSGISSVMAGIVEQHGAK